MVCSVAISGRVLSAVMVMVAVVVMVMVDVFISGHRLSTVQIVGAM